MICFQLPTKEQNNPRLNHEQQAVTSEKRTETKLTITYNFFVTWWQRKVLELKVYSPLECLPNSRFVLESSEMVFD